MASPFPKRSSFEQIYIYPSWGSFHTFTILSQIVSKTRIFKDISFYIPIKNPPYPHSQIWPTLPQGIWFDLWINTTSECFHTSNSFLDKRILRRKKLILLVYFSEQMVFEIFSIFSIYSYVFIWPLLCGPILPTAIVIWKTNLKSIPPEDASIPVTAFLDNIGLNEHV